MPNGTGLLGNIFAAQSSIIVPQPDAAELYYIFTVDAFASGLSYSIVDLTMDNGYGDIVSKNIPLLSPIDEKLTVVRHCNSKDFWIISHQAGTNSFYVYSLTSAGLNLTPSIYSLGTVYSSVGEHGHLKSSPDGTRLASGLMGGDIIELYDFDNSSGVISNAVTLQNLAWFNSLHGIVFSPNSNILYSYWTMNISQYDLLAGTAADILSSELIVGC